MISFPIFIYSTVSTPIISSTGTDNSNSSTTVSTYHPKIVSTTSELLLSTQKLECNTCVIQYANAIIKYAICLQKPGNAIKDPAYSIHVARNSYRT